MPELPVVTGVALIRALERVGGIVIRQRGNHVQVQGQRGLDGIGDNTTFPVPVHPGRTIKRGTLTGILRKAEIEPDKLRRLL